ncbi:TraI domain-containing protein [Pseudoduganella sp. SL102]|uniref:MobH family relaxase n=1 Tax=Pseudoduganella sp. SL102 TaxID=2995154 RepID=UPI00248B4C08|nr:MobH family relaxase [Pseudoduganella sp. SL102]WBS00174.1 TraI domain-containing protein [Pseudoduganella sp. SL102]
MFIAQLLSKLRGGGASEANAAPSPAVEHGVSVKAGIRACSIDELLANHKDIIARIKLCYGSDNATFEADLLAPIRHYAAYVNALPATQNSYFNRPGGLLRLGLETAFYALQATDSQIFAGRQTITNRRMLEPRWRRATFVAGLCGELYRCFNQCKVHDAQGQVWQPYLAPLTLWLRQRRSTHFMVQWLPGPERRAVGLYALPLIVPPATMEDLAFGNEVIVPNMLASISGLATYHDHNVMDRLVRHAVALVVQRERCAPASDASPDEVPAHLARHILEAMRELVQSDHNWLPNAPRSRLWFGTDGLFLVWPNGAADVIRLLADEQLPGAPDKSDAILAILVAAGVVPVRPPGTSIIAIQPPGASEPLDAIPITPPGLLLADVVPVVQPLPEAMVAERPGDTLRAHAAHAASAAEVDVEQIPPHVDDVSRKLERRRTARTVAAGGSTQAQLPLPAMTPPDAVRDGGHLAAAGTHETTAVGGNSPGLPEPVAASHAELRPPMRLNRRVARALAAIVSTLHGERPLCHVVDGSLFVPLSALAEQGVDARQACRSLQDAGMLEPDESGEGVRSTRIDGQQQAGICVLAEYVAGLETPVAMPAQSRGGCHADASL